MKRLIILSTVLALFVTVLPAFSQVENTISLQGVLRDNTGRSVPDGTYNMTFRLFDAAEGGTQVNGWEESLTVTVVNGVYNVILGTIDSFSDIPFDEVYYVEIQRDDADAPMSPRIRLTAVPYAMALVGGDNEFPANGDVVIGGTNDATLEDGDFHINGNVILEGTGKIVFPNAQELTGNVYNALNAADGTPANAVYVDNDGEVGIGTTSPANNLHIYSNANNGGTIFQVSDNTYKQGIRFRNSTGAYTWGISRVDAGSSEADLVFDYDGSDKVFFKNDGKVGIGGSPSTKLDIVSPDTPTLTVRTTATSGKDAVISIRGARDTGTTYDLARIEFYNNDFADTMAMISARNADGTSGTKNGALRFAVNDGTTLTEAMRISDKGYVGIGTSSPECPLHVAGARTSGSVNLRGFGYESTNLGQWTSTTRQISIYAAQNIVADNAIYAVESIAWSDSRAKHIIGVSNAQEDLARLNQLEITDYQWIDHRIDGGKFHKKLIAQDVARVFPEAVTKDIEKAIPNVYEFAETIAYDSEHQKLTVTTNKEHGFNIADKVDVYTNETKLSAIGIEEIISPNTFVISCDHHPEEVFVFGKWVDDYHSIDYEAIAMLNVSATQELSRLVNELQAENASLKTKVETLEAQINELEQLKSDLARVKAYLSEQETSNLKKTSLH